MRGSFSIDAALKPLILSDAMTSARDPDLASNYVLCNKYSRRANETKQLKPEGLYLDDINLKIIFSILK